MGAGYGNLWQAAQVRELQISKELHFAAKILFLNLAQVGAINCNWYRVRLVRKGELSQEKKFRSAEWFGMVRDSSDWFEGSAKRIAGRAQSVRGAKCQSVRAHIGGNPAVTSVTTS